jgi:hypothetical protein
MRMWNPKGRGGHDAIRLRALVIFSRTGEQCRPFSDVRQVLRGFGTSE